MGKIKDNFLDGKISLAFILSFFSAYIVVVSTLYLWGYWGYFGVDILSYVSIGDIVAISAYSVSASLFIFALSYAVGSLGAVGTAKAFIDFSRSEFGEKRRRWVRPLISIIIPGVLLLLFLDITLIYWENEYPGKYTFTAFLSYIVISYFISKNLSKLSYSFDDFLLISRVSTGLIFLLVLSFSYGRYDAAHVVKKISYLEYQFPDKAERYVFLGKAGEYIFLIPYGKDKVLIRKFNTGGDITMVSDDIASDFLKDLLRKFRDWRHGFLGRPA